MLDPSAFNIVYYIVLPNEDLREQTPFQGFTLGIHGARDYVYKILTLPQNLLELKADKQEAIRARALGITCINLIPIEERFIKQLLALAPTPFNILYSFESNHDLVATIIKDYKRPLLHISAVQKEGVLSVKDLSFSAIWDFVQSVKADRVLQNEKLNEFFNKVIGNKRNWRADPCSIKLKYHMLTEPNEIVLKSFYYGMGKGKPLSITKNYSESVFQAAKEVMSIQQASIGKKINASKIGLILTSFGMLKHMYEVRRITDKHAELEREIIRAQKILARQTNYWLDIDPKILMGASFQYIINIRTVETELYTMALSIAACNSFSPVLRLPPGVNLLGPEAKALVTCTRAKPNPNKQKKMNMLFNNIQKKMSGYFCPEYAETVKTAGRNLKIISDAPLEWLPINGLPLMMRKNTSRIPITTGNMMLMQVLTGQRRMVEIDDLKRVLVLRSFSENDILKNQLTYSVKTFGNIAKDFKLDIIFRDIKSEDDFIEAVNSFDGAMMICDGHGGYDKDAGISGLLIGGKLVNIWELKNKLKAVPPIVLLSACDTHPISSSHVTVANGFILLGAITVFSTLMPVTGKDAAIMIGRLIYRIEEYLPIYLKIFGNVIGWNHLVAGLQRMVYMTELMRYLCSRLNVNLTEQLNLELGSRFNHFINSDDDDWYEKSMEHFANKTERSIEQIQEALSKGFFCEVLKYIQIGNPENIVIQLSRQ